MTATQILKAALDDDKVLGMLVRMGPNEREIAWMHPDERRETECSTFHRIRVKDLIPEMAQRLRERAKNERQPGGLLLTKQTASVAELNWDAAADAETYDVYRGSAQDGTDLACFEAGVAGTSTTDDGLLPAAGSALDYVVGSANCSGVSELGADRIPLDPCP